MQIGQTAADRLISAFEPKQSHKSRVAEENPALGRRDEIARQVVLEETAIAFFTAPNRFLSPSVGRPDPDDGDAV